MAFRNDPQSRVIPDTNTWLDAAFWPDSVARRAIATLQASGRPIIIEELIENEALKILAKRRIELALSFDPTEHFKAFTAGFLHVPASDLVRVKVNRADMPVARAAVHYKATILTQDAPLVAECLADNISAQFPWNTLVAQGAAPPAEEILRIVRPGRRIGTIFARVTPGGWLGMKDVGEFTVADVEHIGRLWFDSSGEEWVFDGVQSARMKFSAAGKGQSLICVTYDLPSSGSGKIILRAFSPQSGDKDTRTVATLKKLKADGGQVRVGSSLAGQAYWNGYVRHRGRDDKFGLSNGDHSARRRHRCHFRQGDLLLSEVFRDFTFDMDQVFRKITIRPPTLLARQNDRMAVHVCSWQILLQKSVETGGEA